MTSYRNVLNSEPEGSFMLLITKYLYFLQAIKQITCNVVGGLTATKIVSLFMLQQ